MELYKSRDFSAFFQDTFSFIKLNGKHFFKHFIIVNGLILLVLMIMGYFFMNFYTDVVFGSIMQNNPNILDDYMNENGALFIFLLIVFIIVGLVFSIIMHAYPAFYLKLYNEHLGTNFGTPEIIKLYKANIGKLMTFLVSGILLAIPLLIGIGLLSIILFVTIIGMLALPLVIGGFSLFYVMALMEYLEGKRGVWDSFGYSWNLLSSKFWPAIGSVGLFYLMSYLVQNIVTVIAYIFGMLRFFTRIENNNPNPEEFGGMMSIIMIVMFMAGVILGAFLNNIVLLNQGIVFYSLKEDNENINAKSIIDQIGKGE